MREPPAACQSKLTNKRQQSGQKNKRKDPGRGKRPKENLSDVQYSMLDELWRRLAKPLHSHAADQQTDDNDDGG